VSMPIQGVATVAVPAVVPLTAAADADTDAA
jgi:hypothetical protein